MATSIRLIRRYVWLALSSSAILALVSGCGQNSDQQIADIKSSLSAGDKILYENADEVILSFSNDSLIVRCNVASEKSDTIFRTTPSERIGVYSSPGYITLVRKEDSDSIGVYSYEISSGKIASNKAYGIGYMPYFDSDCISVVSFQNEDGALYEASLTIGLDGSANGNISLEREICKVASSKRSDDIWDSVFSSSTSDMAVYWWHCAFCNERVKSIEQPPYGGCMRRGNPHDIHTWIKGNRAE